MTVDMHQRYSALYWEQTDTHTHTRTRTRSDGITNLQLSRAK